MATIRTLWRVFPWEPDAEAGEPFSPSYINPCQEDGRYDLDGKPLILNLAESPAHAIAEQIQGRHGRNLRAGDLTESGRPLAIVRVTIGDDWSAIPDLSLPRALHRFGCRPDQLMSRDPRCSQRLSRRLHQRGVPGFRVWSALSGDWHCTVLFMDRAVNLSLTFGRPRRLTFRSRGVAQAARARHRIEVGRLGQVPPEDQVDVTSKGEIHFPPNPAYMVFPVRLVPHPLS